MNDWLFVFLALNSEVNVEYSDSLVSIVHGFSFP